MDDENRDIVGRALLDELKRGNELLADVIRLQRNWRLSFWRGLLAGLGGAIGATLLVSLLIWMLQPLKKLEVLKPTLDRIAQELERKPGR
jgi:hypothetical protein